MALQGWTTYKRNGGYEKCISWKAGFFAGATSTIKERLQTPYHAFKTGAGTAIVLYNDKAVSEAVKRVYPRLTTSRRSSVGGYDGRDAGCNAGNHVTLTPQRKLTGTLSLGSGR